MKYMYFCPTCIQKWSFEGDSPSHKVICPDCRKAMEFTRYKSDEFNELSEKEQRNILDKLRQMRSDRSEIRNTLIFGTFLCIMLAYLLTLDNPKYFEREWWSIALGIIITIVMCIFGGYIMGLISPLVNHVLFYKMISKLDKENPRTPGSWIDTPTFLESHNAAFRNLTYVSMIVIFLICVVAIRFNAIMRI